MEYTSNNYHTYSFPPGCILSCNILSYIMFHNKIIFILSLAMLGFTIVASSTIFSLTINLWRKVEKMTHLQIQVFHYL